MNQQLPLIFLLWQYGPGGSKAAFLDWYWTREGYGHICSSAMVLLNKLVNQYPDKPVS